MLLCGLPLLPEDVGTPPLILTVSKANLCCAICMFKDLFLPLQGPTDEYIRASVQHARFLGWNTAAPKVKTPSRFPLFQQIFSQPIQQVINFHFNDTTKISLLLALLRRWSSSVGSLA